MVFPRDVENDGQHVDFEQFWEKPGKWQEMDCAKQNCPQFSMGKRMGIGVGVYRCNQGNPTHKWGRLTDGQVD